MDSVVLVVVVSLSLDYPVAAVLTALAKQAPSIIVSNVTSSYLLICSALLSVAMSGVATS